MPGTKAPEDIGHELQRGLARLTWATVILYAVALVVGVILYVNIHHTTTALCSFRDDLQSRVDTAKEFLKEHPAGFAGVPVATIKLNLKNQEMTLKSLDSLKCGVVLHTK